MAQRDRDQADLRIRGVLDDLLRIIALIHGPLHVRLAASDPDFAHEDIGDLDRVLAGDRQFERTARLQRRELGAKATIFARRGDGLILERDRYLFAVGSGAPYGNLDTLSEQRPRKARPA